MSEHTLPATLIHQSADVSSTHVAAYRRLSSISRIVRELVQEGVERERRFEVQASAR